MDSIIIKVSELLKMAADLANDKMEFVKISLYEPDGEGENALPAHISFDALSKDGFGLIGYEAIDAAFDD